MLVQVVLLTVEEWQVELFHVMTASGGGVSYSTPGKHFMFSSQLWLYYLISPKTHSHHHHPHPPPLCHKTSLTYKHNAKCRLHSRRRLNSQRGDSVGQGS